jgi:hypothetical protein
MRWSPRSFAAGLALGVVVVGAVAASVNGSILAKRRHLASTGARMLIWDDARTPDRFGGRYHLVGTVPAGAECEILETLTIDGNKWSKIRARGRSLTGPENEELRGAVAAETWDLKLSASVTGGHAFDGPELRKQYDAMPDADSVVGWTRWVADE